MMMKRYLEELVFLGAVTICPACTLEQSPDHAKCDDCGADIPCHGNELHDAVEWAIISGWVKLTYKKEQDLADIKKQLSDIIEGYRRTVAAMEEDVPQLALW